MRVHRFFRCLLVLLLTGLALGPASAGMPLPAPLQLQDRQVEVDAWPALRMLVDADGSLTTDAALQRLADFRTPDTPHANLGPRSEVVWLSLPVLATNGDGRWVFNIDYPSISGRCRPACTRSSSTCRPACRTSCCCAWPPTGRCCCR
jgi:hypothetical protein